MSLVNSEEVSFNDVRSMLFRDNSLMDGWLKPLSPEEWKPCWGSSPNQNGVIDTIEARAVPREFNITQTFPNGEEIKTRMSHGEFQWDLKSENDASKTKIFRSKNGVIHHGESPDFIWKHNYTRDGDIINTTINKHTGEITRTHIEASKTSEMLKKSAKKEYKGLSGVLSKSSHPTQGEVLSANMAGVNMAKSVGNIARAGVQAAVITEGFNQWDRLLTHPEIATDAIHESREFYENIKDLPPDQRAKAMEKMSVEVAKEVGKTVKNASTEMVEKGVGVARDLYEMKPETRSQFLKDVCVGTVENLGNMRQSARDLANLPISEKISLAKDLGTRGIEKGKTLFAGAKKIYDSLSSR